MRRAVSFERRVSAAQTHAFVPAGRTVISMPDEEPSRDEVERLRGPVLLEFGASRCGYCQQLAPTVSRLLNEFPGVQHIRIEDGPGRPLGRSFRVKLWPTLVFLRDGLVLGRLVRPDEDEVRRGLASITSEP